MIDIFIEGEPVAQGRPRAFSRGGHIGFYDPKESKTWKAEVAAQLKAFRYGSKFAAGVPLVLELSFYLTRPKSVKPEKRPHHVVKPDLDNLVKAVLDAAKGIAWHDDCQVVRTVAGKSYIDRSPGVRFCVREYKS